MGYSRLSITVPDELFEELKAIAKKRKIKLSHLVTDAIREKNNRLKEEAFVQQVNDFFRIKRFELSNRALLKILQGPPI